MYFYANTQIPRQTDLKKVENLRQLIYDIGSLNSLNYELEKNHLMTRNLDSVEVMEPYTNEDINNYRDIIIETLRK